MAKKLIIEGRVQGVGYRASFAAQATELGLAGWVRNRRDGSVEACIEGDGVAIDKMLMWAKRGPPAAMVTGMLITEHDETIQADITFAILPTH